MATEKPEQDTFLVIIDAKIAALQALVESYRAALSVGALGQPGDTDLPTLTPGAGVSARQDGFVPVDLPIGVFRDKSIPEAIKMYLAAGRRKQTAKEITAGLKEGGLVSTSKDFERTVTGTLHRLKGGVVLWFKDGWDLAESYPDHLRTRIGNENGSSSKPKAKPKKKTRRRRSKPKAKGPGLDSRIESVLTGNTTLTFTPDTIANKISVDVRVVRLALGRLVKKNKATKLKSGYYAVYRQSAERAQGR